MQYKKLYIGSFTIKSILFSESSCKKHKQQEHIPYAPGNKQLANRWEVLQDSSAGGIRYCALGSSISSRSINVEFPHG